ncbi:MAG: zinc ribbon domain-containing protein [Sporolactobacillus sp.]
MPYCHSCGTKLKEDQLFCPQCGAEVQYPGHSLSVTKAGRVKKATRFSLHAKVIAGIAAVAVAITGAGIALSHMAAGSPTGEMVDQKSSAISIRISSAFKKTYSTSGIGTWGSASYERPLFDGTSASVATMNAFFETLEQKWNSENQTNVETAQNLLNNRQQQGNWTYDPDSDNYTNEVSCKASYNQNSLISIVMEKKANMPGNGHGSDNLFSYTFDTVSGNQLTLSDVLNSATKDSAIIQAFEEQDSKDFSSGGDNDIKLRNNPEAVNFYLDAKGVCLYLNANQQAADASDTITVTIPYTSSFISARLKTSD